MTQLQHGRIRRRTIVAIGIIAILAGVTTAGYLGDWSTFTLPDSLRSTATNTPPNTSEASADARFATAGEAPITTDDRGVVDLAGTRDTTAPTLGVPNVRCNAARAVVVVDAADDNGVTDVRARSTTANGEIRTVPFAFSDGRWQATVPLTLDGSEAVTVIAADNAGNTHSRIVTNLCS